MNAPLPLEDLGYIAPDYLEQCDLQEAEQIRTLRAERQANLFAERFACYKDAVKNVSDLRPSVVDLDTASLQIGRAEDLSDDQKRRLDETLDVFCPWKKGPFSCFGVDIDAEWRSDWKWDRVFAHSPPLEGKRIADIGCHNGYFMFRMAAHNPQFVVGIEPYPKNQWMFQLFQQWLQLDNIHFDLLGVEHMDLFEGCFDVIYCLGILYHHTDPIGLLRKIRYALAPGGTLIVDCQGIPGDQPVSLVPRKRYAKARGIWNLPTQSCLEHWIVRSGYANVETFFSEPLSIEEQRRTKWADIESLRDFLDIKDITKTVEGYPAPWRHYVKAKRG